VRQRVDGRWEARARIGGRRRSFLAKTQREALSKMRTALTSAERGLPFTGVGLRVRDWLPLWLESARDTVRPRTHDSYRVTAERHIIPVLGHYRLPELQPHHVEALMRDLLKSGLSPKTIKNVHGVLRRALNIAEQRGYVLRNVARLVTPPRVESEVVEPLTVSEMQAFLAHARNDRLGTLFVTAIVTGARQGELLGLRWDDLDLDGATLSIRRTLHRRGGVFEFGEVKTRASRRTLALPDDLVAELRAHHDRQRWERGRAGALWESDAWGDLVFATEVGGPLAGYAATKRFQRLLAVAGVRHVRFHDLRHGTATYLLSQGVDLKTVSTILGHAQIHITANLYAHVQHDLKREAAARLGAVVFGA
jgi:integrase